MKAISDGGKVCQLPSTERQLCTPTVNSSMLTHYDNPVSLECSVFHPRFSDEPQRH